MEPPAAYDHISTFQLLIYKKQPQAADAEEGCISSEVALGADSAEGAAAQFGAGRPSAVEYAVIEFLGEEEAVRAEDVVRRTGKSRATVNRLLNRLISQGLVERIGGHRGPGVAYRLPRA